MASSCTKRLAFALLELILVQHVSFETQHTSFQAWSISFCSHSFHLNISSVSCQISFGQRVNCSISDDHSANSGYVSLLLLQLILLRYYLRRHHHRHHLQLFDVRLVNTLFPMCFQFRFTSCMLSQAPSCSHSISSSSAGCELSQKKT